MNHFEQKQPLRLKSDPELGTFQHKIQNIGDIKSSKDETRVKKELPEFSLVEFHLC